MWPSILVLIICIPLSIALAAIFLQTDVAPRNPTLEFVARSYIAWLMLATCALYGVFASIALRISGYGGLSQWTVARAFKWTMWLLAGVTFEIQDQEQLSPRPAVFISNHQTELDVLFLGCMFPPYCSVTAKKSLMWTPFLGWFMALSKTVFIDRGNSKTAKAAFDGAVQTMKTEKQSVFIFPEGTRSYYDHPDMLQFKKGAFHLAVQAQVPIVPVVVSNYSNVLNIRRRRFHSGTIPVRALAPISTKGMTAADVDQLVTTTRDKMLKELVTLTEIARGQKIAVPESQADGVTKASKATGVAR